MRLGAQNDRSSRICKASLLHHFCSHHWGEPPLQASTTLSVSKTRFALMFSITPSDIRETLWHQASSRRPVACGPVQKPDLKQGVPCLDILEDAILARLAGAASSMPSTVKFIHTI